MKRFLILGALFALSACQTTSQSGSDRASVSEPLNSEVVFGTEAIHDGEEHNTWKFIFKNRGRKSVVTIQNTVAINQIRNPKTIEYGIKILKSSVSVPNAIRGRTGIEEEMTSLRDKAFRYVYRHKKAESGNIASFGDLQEGYINLRGNQEEIVKSMIESASKSYFGGQRVTQGEKVFAMDFCVISGTYPGGSGPCDSPEFFGYIAGKTVYDGRSVIMVEVDDHMAFDDQKIDVDGFLYVDLDTGMALFSEIKFSGIKRDGMNADIVKTRLVKLPTS